MPLIETLITTVGFAVAKGTLNIWLKEDAIPLAIGDDLIELVKAKTNDVIAARKGKRFFEGLGDKVAKSLESIFDEYVQQAELQRQSGHPASFSIEAVSREVAEAIDSGHLSSKLMAQLDHDPSKITDYVKQTHGEPKHFSELEKDLYERALDLSIQYVVDLGPALPGYANSNFSEILERLGDQDEKIDEVIKRLENLQEVSEANSFTKKYADFEKKYRASIIRKFDRVNLFGADIRRETKRYRLSVAYVSLNVIELQKVRRSSLTSSERLPVDEALSNSTRSVVTGDAGSGKTTLLQWLAVNAAANSFGRTMISWKEKIPFLIELRYFIDMFPAPEEFVTKVLPEIAEEMPKAWVHDILRSGRAILLVDGLDEISSNKRNQFFDWLETIVENYSGIHIVISSRPTSYKLGHLSSLKFRELNLAPMDMNEIPLFIQYWHNAVLIDPGLEDKKQIEIITEKLRIEIKNSIPLSKLATNPLLCAIICALFYERNMQLPSDRLALYEDCCSMLIERRDIEREVSLGDYPRLTYTQKRILLDDISYWMVKNGYASFNSRQAYDRINARLPNMQLSDTNPKDIFRMLVERSGMIRELSGESFDFLHKTFQEYMAANAATTEGDWGLLIKNAADDQWKETIVICAGLANKTNADQLIANILGLKSKNKNQRAYLDLLAISCLETAIEVSSEIRGKVKKILKSIIPPKKREQINSLVAVGELAIPFLGPNGRFSEDDQISCIEILSRIGSKNAIKKLGEYAGEKNSKIMTAFDNALRLISPEIVSSSGLSEIILSNLNKFVSGNNLGLSGPIINALSREPISKWKSKISQNIHSLKIKDAYEACLYVTFAFPNIITIDISGYTLPTDLSPLSKLDHLSAMTIGNKGDYWPRFYITRLKSLFILRLESHGMSWPNITWKSVPNLMKLELVSSSGDLPDLEDYLMGLAIKHLHLSSPVNVDLEVLQNEALETLEITLSADAFPEALPGIELLNLKKVIINVDRITSDVNEFVKEMQISYTGEVVLRKNIKRSNKS